MSTIETQKCRIGKPIPRICGTDTAEELVLYTFGKDYQTVINCNGTDDVLLSEEACLRSLDEDAYQSAQFRVQPNVDSSGNLSFSASVNLKVISTNETCDPGTGFPSLNIDNSPRGCNSEPVFNSSCIIRNTDDNLPDPIVDTQSLNFSYDNQGLVTLSVSILSKNKNYGSQIEAFSLKLSNNREFQGFVVEIYSDRLEDSDFLEYKIKALGEIVRSSSGNSILSL